MVWKTYQFSGNVQYLNFLDCVNKLVKTDDCLNAFYLRAKLSDKMFFFSKIVPTIVDDWT